MKKAKFMLAAIAVVGIVGGSLAFTAKKTAVGFYTAPINNNLCTFVTGITTSLSGTQVNAFLAAGQPGQTHACTTTVLTVAQP